MKALTPAHIALALGCVAIVCTAVVVAVFVMNNNNTVYVEVPMPVAAITGGSGVITAENIAEIQQETAEQVERGMFRTHMNTTWVFPDGNSPSTNSVIGNSASNNYPFWFTLTLIETGDVLYTSGLIPLGSYMTGISLDIPLPAGEHEAVVSINMIDDEGEPVDSNVGLGVILFVQS